MKSTLTLPAAPGDPRKVREPSPRRWAHWAAGAGGLLDAAAFAAPGRVLGGALDWPLVREVVLPFALTRAALALVTALAPGLAPRAAHRGGNWGALGDTPGWVDGLARWDGQYYLRIAADGYSGARGDPSILAFTPLLPLVMNLGASIPSATSTRAQAQAVVGALAANGALLVSLALLWRWFRAEYGPAVARAALVTLALMPTGFFWSTVYPHALFLLGTVTALSAARANHWGWATLGGVVVVLSRTYGLAIVVPLALDLLGQRPPPRTLLRRAALLSFVPCTFLAWAAYAYALSGRPLAALTAVQAWRGLDPPWASLTAYLAGFSGHGGSSSPLDLAFFVLYLALTIAAWRLVHPSLALFSTLLLGVFVASGTLLSVPRYGLDLVAIYPVLGQLGVRLGRWALVPAVFAWAGGLLLAGVFALGYWVA